MSTTITEKLMRSTDTRHTAQPVTGGWEVTWLPAKVLSRNQAITAMTLAEIVGRVPVEGDPAEYYRPLWGHIENWAAELGMSGPNAVSRASESPEDAMARLEDERCPDCGRASCTGEDCYWPDEAGIARPERERGELCASPLNGR